LTFGWTAGADERAFVTLPAKSFETKDPVTRIPLTIRISPFTVSRTEVTQQDYARVAGTKPSVHKGDDLPVENVSWWDSIRYCNLRSLQEGLSPCYDLTTGKCDRSRNGYRLLTAAESDYAAGETSGAENRARQGNLGLGGTKDTRALLEYARSHGTLPVGSLPANENGLNDLYGNVWEWIEDYHDPSGSVSGAIDLEGPAWGMARVIRGGSYLTTASN
jgi:formylglycine-generating enzyme required for sulfatase activity